MKSILMGYRTPWLVEFWAHNRHLGIFVHLPNRLAIADHASVTHLTSGNNPPTSSLSTTTTTSRIAMPPPCLAATTEIHPQPLVTTMAGPNMVDNNMSTPHQHMNECPWGGCDDAAHLCCITSVLHHPTAMLLTAMGQWEWQTRNIRHFCCSLVSPPIILLWFITWIPSATSPDDEHGCPPLTLTINDSPHPTTSYV